MRHSPEALTAFAEAATLGSFSAAARKLGKSQSTVSSAIANLEIDLGLTLFDRSSRKPTLTEPGRVLLGKVQDILAASDRLDRAASQLGGGLEPKLSVVWSDTYQSDRFEDILGAFEQRFPDLEFECLIAEHGDLVSLVQTGRAQIGVVGAQDCYPPDIGAATIAEQSEITLFVAAKHALAHMKDITPDVLANFRELRLATYLEQPDQAVPAARRAWSAPSYLMLLEMAVLGFGWAAIPRWMVTRFALGKLHELDARGWPRRVPVDAVWSRQRPLGRAGTWLLQ
ncbi:MAG: LysR family transcriptional regulator, partial [Pseudomonadota bacterium]